MALRKKYRTVSIETRNLHNSLAVSHDPTAELDDKIDVELLLATLPQRDRRIVRMYYLEGFTQVEISRTEGLSQVAILKIIKKSLKLMKKEL